MVTTVHGTRTVHRADLESSVAENIRSVHGLVHVETRECSISVIRSVREKIVERDVELQKAHPASLSSDRVVDPTVVVFGITISRSQRHRLLQSLSQQRPKRKGIAQDRDWAVA